MEIGEEIELRIEKLVAGGEGLGRHDDCVVFVKGACPNELVKVKVTQLTKSYARADIVDIIEPSIHRVAPFCALHNACGGCGWQFLDYEQQLVQKRNIVKENLKSIAAEDFEVNEVIKSPLQKNFRHKIQYPVAQTKNSKRLLVGYYKQNSHEIVNIKHCPIQPEIIDIITASIREMAQKHNITVYNERKHKGELRHIVFRHSSSKNHVLIGFVINAKMPSEPLTKLANELYAKYPDIIGICYNSNTDKTNRIIGDTTKLIIGQDFTEERLDEMTYRISFSSFFQVNPLSAVGILDTVKNLIAENAPNAKVIETHSGVSAIGIWLRDICKEVYCVESSDSAVEDAKKNVVINGANNVKIFHGDVEQILKEFIEQNEIFDVAIVDPPRKGMDEKSLETLSQLTNNYIIYVSCNPTTLARDIKYLRQKGFEPLSFQPVDMFCHTHHIETVALLKKT